MIFAVAAPPIQTAAITESRLNARGNIGGVGTTLSVRGDRHVADDAGSSIAVARAAMTKGVSTPAVITAAGAQSAAGADGIVGSGGSASSVRGDWARRCCWLSGRGDEKTRLWWLW